MATLNTAAFKSGAWHSAPAQPSPKPPWRNGNGHPARHPAGRRPGGAGRGAAPAWREGGRRMKPHRYDRISYPDFVVSPAGKPRPELRNPERTVGRWMLALAIVAGVLLIMGVI